MTNIIFVLLLTAASLLLLLTIYVYLLFRKAFNQIRAKKKERWLKQNSHDIDIYLTTGWGSFLFTVTEEYQFEALEDRLGDYLDNFKLEGDLEAISELVDRNLVPRYRKRLRHSRWSTRMNTLYFVNLFQIKDMQDDLIRHVTSKLCSPEEKYEIYLILAAFEYPDLMELLKNAKGIPSFLLTELMSYLVNQDNVDEYAEHFYDFASSWQWTLLDVVRDKNLRTEKLQDLLEELMVSEDRELRIRALKTIASLGYISSAGLVVRLLENIIESGSWDSPQVTGEKLMAARLMGNIRYEEFMPYLLRLVGDKVYSVRSEAAKAIRMYKNGVSMLQTIVSTHPDPYARNISHEWMERSLDYE